MHHSWSECSFAWQGKIRNLSDYDEIFEGIRLLTGGKVHIRHSKRY